MQVGRRTMFSWLWRVLPTPKSSSSPAPVEQVESAKRWVAAGTERPTRCILASATDQAAPLQAGQGWAALPADSHSPMAMTQLLTAVRPSCLEVLPTQPAIRGLAVAPASTPVSTAWQGSGSAVARHLTSKSKQIKLHSLAPSLAGAAALGTFVECAMQQMELSLSSLKASAHLDLAGGLDALCGQGGHHAGGGGGGVGCTRLVTRESTIRISVRVLRSSNQAWSEISI